VSFHDLNTLIDASTVVYRKGDVVTKENVGGVDVTTVDAFPPTPDQGTLIDVHFVTVGFTEHAADRAGFLTVLRAAFGPGEFQDVTAARFTEGPSYIELGAWLGDQTQALRLIALGAHYGLWDVFTPATFRLTGQAADRLAGNGMVMPAAVSPEVTDGL
jgi:hypothetical protein